MENLNAEQVKKALQGHIGVVDMRCEKCPYNQDNGSEICIDLLMTDALALINSQEQRIKELTEENERLRAIPEQICEQARQMCFIVGDEEYVTLCELDQIAKEMLGKETKNEG